MTMSTADYQRQWRARKGAATGKPGRPVTAECGTVAAYKRHQRKAEPLDQACRNAWSAYQRQLYQRRKNPGNDSSRPTKGHTGGNQSQSEMVLDYLEHRAYLVTPMRHNPSNSGIIDRHITTPGGAS
jgi:hypothetical protein